MGSDAVVEVARLCRRRGDYPGNCQGYGGRKDLYHKAFSGLRTVGPLKGGGYSCELLQLPEAKGLEDKPAGKPCYGTRS